ncbi:MAG: ribonuclease HII [Parcubacteria bacterium C7867-006]|nr:MAG: ribonuclease HII [Parcubacteria bacterium C7867-006]
MKIVGIDEVGRGPLAGPVTVCAVSCDEKIYKSLFKNKNLPALGKDSKKLKEKDREFYNKYLKKLSKEGVIDYQVVHISNLVIDKKGISYSIKKAIQTSIYKLKIDKNSKILLDGGLRVGVEFKNQKTIIKGDEKERIIAWASILAKVSRDSLMKKNSIKFPEYGFDIHKGYGTEKHRDMIKKHGISAFHRKTFCKI